MVRAGERFIEPALTRIIFIFGSNVKIVANGLRCFEYILSF